MSLVKKVVFLIILFIGFIIYSVYSFDFDSSSNTQTLVYTPIKTEISSNDTGLIDKIINFFVKELKPFNLVLTKKDGIVTMDGVFANQLDVKRVADILNINRDGEYTYEDDITIDEVLLSKVAVLMTPFKDFFAVTVRLLSSCSLWLLPTDRLTESAPICETFFGFNTAVLVVTILNLLSNKSKALSNVIIVIS